MAREVAANAPSEEWEGYVDGHSDICFPMKKDIRVCLLLSKECFC